MIILLIIRINDRLIFDVVEIFKVAGKRCPCEVTSSSKDSRLFCRAVWHVEDQKLVMMQQVSRVIFFHPPRFRTPAS